MTTSSHDDLIDLVQGADPIDADAEPMTADAIESVLREILAAPRTETRERALPSRTVVVRLAGVGAAAAVVFGVVNAVTGDNGGGVAPASAETIRHAIAALDQPSDTILHVDMTGTQNNGDGTTITWRDQSWQQNSSPYDRRQVETTPGGTTTESANVGDTEQVYDPATNTIYDSAATGAAQHPKLFLTPGPRAGTYVVHPALYLVHRDGTFKVVPGKRGTLVITAAQAKALRNGTARLGWKHSDSPNALNGHTLTIVHKAPPTSPSDADPSSSDFRSQILALLQSGGATVVGHATVDGRDTLEIASADGHTTYYVDPSSYDPVRLDTTGSDGGTSLTFTTWEELPANDANDALLSLAAQHPSATVDHSQADYLAAEKRLFPNG